MAQNAGIRRLRWIAISLCLLGVAFSAVALYEHVIYTRGLATGPSFCHISEHINCEAVNASKWSVVLGIPIASYGIFFYLCILGFALVAGPSRALSLEVFARLTFLGAFIASSLAIVLFLISEFVIGALCIVCLCTYLINFLLLAAAWRYGSNDGGPKDGLVKRLISGVKEGTQFFSTLFGSAPNGAMSTMTAWLVLASLCVVAYGAAILPDVVFGVVSQRVTPEPMWLWEHAPKKEISTNLDGSAFGDYSKGVPNAPIQIVEFADFECPACRRLHSVLKSVLEKFPGTYQVVFRNYPLDVSCNPGFGRPMHRYACPAAFFSRCAGEQGKFWEAVDFLFHYEGLEGDAAAADLESELIEVGSRDLVLDKDAVKECLRSGRYGQKILDDVAEGNRIGLTGTPAVWINGKAVPNALLLSLERVFAKILDLPVPPHATILPHS